MAAVLTAAAVAGGLVVTAPARAAGADEARLLSLSNQLRATKAPATTTTTAPAAVPGPTQAAAEAVPPGPPASPSAWLALALEVTRGWGRTPG